MSLFGLHSGLCRFRLNGVLQHIQQINDLHILVGGVFQSLIYPFIGLAAHIDKQIAVGYLDNVVGGRLIAVQIDAVVQQQGNLSVVCLVSQNFTDPVVLREDGGDNADFCLRRGFRLGWGRSGGRGGGNGGHIGWICAAGQHSGQHQNRKQCGNYFFHIVYPPNDKNIICKMGAKIQGQRQHRKSLSENG